MFDALIKRLETLIKAYCVNIPGLTAGLYAACTMQGRAAYKIAVKSLNASVKHRGARLLMEAVTARFFAGYSENPAEKAALRLTADKLHEFTAVKAVLARKRGGVYPALWQEQKPRFTQSSIPRAGNAPVFVTSRNAACIPWSK